MSLLQDACIYSSPEKVSYSLLQHMGQDPLNYFLSVAMAQNYRWCLATSICGGEIASKTSVEGSQGSVALSYKSHKHMVFLTLYRR